MAIQDHYFIKQYRTLAGLSPQVRSLFVRSTTTIFLFELVKILPPLLFKLILDRLIVPGDAIDASAVLIMLAGYLLSLLAMSGIEYFIMLRVNAGVRDAEVDISERTLSSLLSLDIAYHERNETGASMNRMLKGGAKVNELLYDICEHILPVFFQSLFTLVVLFALGFEIGIAFLFFIPMFLIIMARGARETQPHREEYHLHQDRFASLATQSVSNVRTVKDFANEEKEMGKARAALRSYSMAVGRRMEVGLRNGLTQDVVLNVARGVTLALAVWLMLQGRITAGSLVLAMTLSEKAYLNLARLHRSYYRMQDAEPSIGRFDQVLRAPVQVRDDPSSTREVRKGTIAFRDVTFAYQGSPTPALKGVSFEVKAKETVALVGRSGSGKSTAVKLLLRHADPQQGEILVDGVPLTRYALRRLRGSIAVVSQDVELFNESVFDNIAYGVDGARKEDVVRAARMAHAHGFIEALPQGYDTMIGERGVRLSGGQKQRLAIARALLRSPKILIFDEATSSLDALSEREIHKSIAALSGKITLVIIAHRFSTIERADRIVLLEGGEVAEIGTHDQLVKKKGIFARLRRLQELGDVR